MKARPAVVVLTGAGISADSGLATFRGAHGLWEGVAIEEVATPEAWERDPRKVWGFYQARRAALGTVEPNAAHRALAELEQRLEAAGVPFTLVTQNVDDLHERAGSGALLHMHGELALLRCEACEGRRRDTTSIDPGRFLACERCGHERLRPDVVWFGELPYHLEDIEQRLLECTDFLAIGTSGVVYPAAGMLAMARACGARTIVQALERPDNLSVADRFVAGRASEVLPGLLEELAAAWCDGAAS
jgi:NAD-dependent deacetylase